MPTLYDLTDQWGYVYRLAEDGVFDPATLHDTLDAINEAIEDKAVGYAKVIKQIDADAETIDAEIKRLTERRNSYTRNVATLKQVLMNAMNETGNRKFKTPLFTISIRGNGGKQPLAIDEKQLQADAFRIQRVPDNDAIRQRLANGETILGAKFKPRGEHLEVK